MNRPNIHEIQAKSAKNKAAWGKTPPVVGAVVIQAKPNPVRPGNGAFSVQFPDIPELSAVEREQSEIEALFEIQIRAAGLPLAKRNVVFLPGRKYEADFCWPDKRLIVSVEGMAHRIKGRFKADIEKHALALIHGWTVLRVDGRSIRSGKAIEWFEQLFRIVASRAPAKNSADGMEGTPMK